MLLNERDVGIILQSLGPMVKKVAKLKEAEMHLGSTGAFYELNDYLEKLTGRLVEASQSPEFLAQTEERMRIVRGEDVEDTSK